VIATLSLVVLLGTLLSAITVINTADREFEGLVRDQFRSASSMTESIFDLVGQMGLARIFHNKAGANPAYAI